MAGEGMSRYVILTKDQDSPLEEIQDGELNEPVRVQLEVQRCHVCGQSLPEGYQLPADEPWTTGIFGCTEDTDSCWTGLFCPCVLFGRNIEEIREDVPWTTPCTFHAIFIEGGIALVAATAIFHGIYTGIPFLIGEGVLFGWVICGIEAGLARQSLQNKYHLKNSPCHPCAVHCCMHWCAICQEHREMKGHLSDDAITAMTVVNPPPVQEMNTNEGRDQENSENGIQSQHAALEMQAL